MEFWVYDCVIGLPAHDSIENPYQLTFMDSVESVANFLDVVNNGSGVIKSSELICFVVEL